MSKGQIIALSIACARRYISVEAARHELDDEEFEVFMARVLRLRQKYQASETLHFTPGDFSYAG